MNYSVEDYKATRGIDNIENGYFILTMFPSLKCELNCPHCYLTKKQRSGETYLEKGLFIDMIVKVKEYYQGKNITNPTIIFYWYGGEPTALPLSYYKELINEARTILPSSYDIKNHFLTNLFTLDNGWLDFLHTECDNKFQTSYDYLMRGEKYLQRWMKNMKKVTKMGFEVSAINVFNNTMLGKEEEIYSQLKEMNANEVGFLPFMKNYANLGNDAKEYRQWYANMSDFSDFLIKFLKIHLEDLKGGGEVISVGNVAHIIKNMKSKSFYNNIAGQTLFFLESGDFALPDYVNGYMDRKEIEFQDVEYLNKFEKIQNNSFEDVLLSKKREDYLKRQIDLNHNEKCIKCEYKSLCSMEFWKSDNLDNSGECPGNERFIRYVLEGLSVEEMDLLKKHYVNIELS